MDNFSSIFSKDFWSAKDVPDDSDYGNEDFSKPSTLHTSKQLTQSIQEGYREKKLNKLAPYRKNHSLAAKPNFMPKPWLAFIKDQHYKNGHLLVFFHSSAAYQRALEQKGSLSKTIKKTHPEIRRIDFHLRY